MVEHASDPSTTRCLPRRSLLGGAATLLGAALAGGAALSTTPEPAVAVDGDPAALEVGGDPTVTSNDGRIEAVYLSPELDVSWTDFGDGVEEITLTLAVGSDAGVDVVYAETLSDADPTGTPGDVREVDGAAGDAPDFDATHGGVTVGFERADATERGDAVTSDALSEADLAGGETATTTLDVVLRADVVGGADEASVVRTATVDVAVDNPSGDSDAGGTVGVDAA